MSTSAKTVSGVTVEGVLGPGGALSAALERYEHRPEQLHMALEVERAFEKREVLLAEAGTGTGKTLAYLVPAVLSGRKVVISTATKNLQEQVFFKDMPLLKERVGVEFEAALLKGRSNYLCLQRFEQFDHAPEFASREDEKLYPALRAWALKTEVGDRAELELPDHFATWADLSTTAETCLGMKCPLFEPCFVTRARRRAERADVIVVNHHLFFADLVLKARGVRNGDGVIPRYDAVVFDEAHALEDIATEYFGVSVSNFRFEDLVRDAMKALPTSTDRGGMLAAVALQLRGRAEAYFKAASLKLPGRGDGAQPLGPQTLQGALGLRADLQTSLGALASMCSNAEEPEVVALARRAGELGSELEFITDADSLEHVFWAEPHGRGLFLRAAPIDIAKEMQLRLYSAVDTVVFTSATLTADNRFDFFARRMGLQGERVDEDASVVRQVRVDSPFDYPRQAALYAPTHLPEPAAPGFIEAVSEELFELANVTGGRAFFLFTSLRNMTTAHALLKNRLPYQVLLQGERPKSTLLAEFQEQPSVLFASHSFWEGVDVPGEALSLVVIDKLPFNSPSDPVVAARIRRLEENGEDPFNAYQLPEAAISLRQGFGRLIRTKDDRGIVAILDRRLHTKAYGRVLLRSLPKAQRLQSIDHLKDWFE